MIRGLYTAATGMIHQRQKLDTIANNLSNTNTRGYKKDDIASRSFRDELLIRTGNRDTGPKALGPLNHGVYGDTVTTFFQDGPLQGTNLMTDIALQGDGFFTILGEDGEAFTRDGSFKVDGEGMLVTQEGHRVAGDYGPIHVGHEEFEVDSQGYIWQGYELVNRLSIANFENPALLEKVGDNLFASSGEDNPFQAFEGEVLQHYVEGSNVDLVEEMSQMIVVSRSYEANQRVLQMIDSTLTKAVNEVGSV